MVEQNREGDTTDIEPIPGCRFMAGAINLGGLGFVVYSIENPTDRDLNTVFGIQEATVGNPVIRKYLDEHPEEIAQQEPTISRLMQQIRVPQANP